MAVGKYKPQIGGNYAIENKLRNAEIIQVDLRVPAHRAETVDVDRKCEEKHPSPRMYLYVYYGAVLCVGGLGVGGWWVGGPLRISVYATIPRAFGASFK